MKAKLLKKIRRKFEIEENPLFGFFLISKKTGYIFPPKGALRHILILAMGEIRLNPFYTLFNPCWDIHLEHARGLKIEQMKRRRAMDTKLVRVGNLIKRVPLNWEHPNRPDKIEWIPNAPELRSFSEGGRVRPSHFVPAPMEGGLILSNNSFNYPDGDSSSNGPQAK